jgi:hypothetical protein
MRGQRQGVQSTKVAELTKDTLTPLPHQKKNDIFIAEHEVKSICMQIKPDFSWQYRALATSTS